MIRQLFSIASAISLLIWAYFLVVLGFALWTSNHWSSTSPYTSAESVTFVHIRFKVFGLRLPAQPVLILTAVLPTMWLCLRVMKRFMKQSATADQCGRCSYDLTGNVSGICPECGTDIAAQGEMAGQNANPHRETLIYAIGVGILFIVQLAVLSSWPSTSNSLAPGKAEAFMAGKVVGGAALAWLLLGVRRILLSPHARRNVFVWCLVIANVIAVCPLLAQGYD